MKFAELIPQVFYDAIARIPSGLILLVSIVAIWYDELAPVRMGYTKELSETFSIVAFMTIVVAYILAFLMEGVNTLIFEPLSYHIIKVSPKWFQELTNGKNRRLTIWSNVFRDFCIMYPSYSGRKFQCPSDAIAIDALRLKSPEVGARIVKLRSEVALCKTLSVGWIIILLFLLFQCFVAKYLMPTLNTKSSYIFPILILLIGIVSIVSRCITINNRHFQALYNHWFLLVNPGLPLPEDFMCDCTSVLSDNLDVFMIPVDSIQKDVSLKKPNMGYRKIVVTKVYEEKETPATQVTWKSPEENELCPVLPTQNLEVAVFTQLAHQTYHFHKIATEMYSVLEGEMQIMANGERFTLQTGDIIIINPGTKHCITKTKQPFLCRVITANCCGESDKYACKEK